MNKDRERIPIGDPLTGKPEEIAKDPSRRGIAQLAAAVVVGNRLIANGTPPEDANKVVHGIIESHPSRKRLIRLIRTAQEIREIPQKPFIMDWD